MNTDTFSSLGADAELRVHRTIAEIGTELTHNPDVDAAGMSKILLGALIFNLIELGDSLEIPREVMPKIIAMSYDVVTSQRKKAN